MDPDWIHWSIRVCFHLADSVNVVLSVGNVTIHCMATLPAAILPGLPIEMASRSIRWYDVELAAVCVYTCVSGSQRSNSVLQTVLVFLWYGVVRLIGAL